MLRFKLKELIAEKQFQNGKRVTLTEISKATEINRVTLSKMANQRGYSTVTGNLDLLCTYFGCRIEQLVEHIPDEMPSKKQSSQIDSITSSNSSCTEPLNNPASTDRPCE